MSHLTLDIHGLILVSCIFHHIIITVGFVCEKQGEAVVVVVVAAVARRCCCGGPPRPRSPPPPPRSSRTPGGPDPVDSVDSVRRYCR